MLNNKEGELDIIINEMDNKQMIDLVLKGIQYAIDSNENELLETHIRSTKINIQNLKKYNTEDKIIFCLLKFINKIIMNIPTLRNNACNNMDETISNNLNDITFERHTLLELKKILKECKDNKQYKNLESIILIILAIEKMQEFRHHNFKVDLEVYSCAINGIDYIPTTQKNTEYNFKEPIIKSIKTLRKEKK